jgi:hypothetical protein
MAREADRLAGTVGSGKAGSLLSRFLADENEFDRRALWRLGTWGAAAIGAVIVATLANQSSIGLRREQTAAADLARQARELQSLTRESQGETRRLASAVDTLNADRDRLYSRVTVLEQGLESVTGALARQNAAASASATPQAATAKSNAASASASAPADPPPAATPAAQATASAPPTIAPVATTAPALTERPKPEKAEKPETPAPAQAQASAAAPPQQDQPSSPAGSASLPKIASTTASASAAASSLLPPKSLMAPPDPAASKLEPAKDSAKLPTSPAPAASPETAPAQPSANDDDAGSDSASGAKVERTEFAVDLGNANSVGGLRALWRGLVKSNADLAALKPIIVVKERSNGLGMQLRLAAGPLMDAAAAAKICAALNESERTCETTVFDGQRLALGSDDADKSPVLAQSQKAAPAPRGRHSVQKHSRRDDPPPAPPKPEPSTLSSFFGRK